jgi:hypothetical protein
MWIRKVWRAFGVFSFCPCTQHSKNAIWYPDRYIQGHVHTSKACISSPPMQWGVFHEGTLDGMF